MLSSKSDTSGDDISITAQAEKRVDDSIRAPSIGWNAEHKDVQIPRDQLTHRQISKCNLFEEYIKLPKSEYGQTSRMKRFRSEELALSKKIKSWSIDHRVFRGYRMSQSSPPAR
uniref:AT28681p n=1 Tax=Drosophila melanogaster TaxID=7227 RepID=Q8MZ71_DROME|nr:AT28681p [Drosophila melanogaster]